MLSVAAPAMGVSTMLPRTAPKARHAIKSGILAEKPISRMI